MSHVAERGKSHGLFTHFPSFHCSAFRTGTGTRKQACFSRYAHLLNTLSSGKALCFLLFVSICLVSITYDSTHGPLWGGWHTIRYHKSHSAIRVCLPAPGQDALDVVPLAPRLCVYTAGHTQALCHAPAWLGWETTRLSGCVWSGRVVSSAFSRSVNKSETSGPFISF